MSARIDWCKAQPWWTSAEALMNAGMIVEIHAPAVPFELTDVDDEDQRYIGVLQRRTGGGVRVYGCANAHWHVFGALHHTVANDSAKVFRLIHLTEAAVSVAVERGVAAIREGADALKEARGAFDELFSDEDEDDDLMN